MSSTSSATTQNGSHSLASRYRRRDRQVLPSVESTIEDHKELLRPLIEFFEERGRAPAEDELPGGDEIRERFGSLLRALRLVQRAHDAEEWRKVVTARGEDLLIFLALSRFDGRPRFGQLPLPVRRDIRAIFSSYRRACEEADVALVAVGDMGRVSKAARGSGVGKLTPPAIYVHESALDSLPPLLRLYEGCARGYIGRVEGANVIKLHTDEPKVSYLAYPEFESNPHPALAEGMTVHLQTFRVRERDYRGSKNPPILHRKETFLAPDHPFHPKFARLTRQEESKGLYEETTNHWHSAGLGAGALGEGVRPTRASTRTRQIRRGFCRLMPFGSDRVVAADRYASVEPALATWRNRPNVRHRGPYNPSARSRMCSSPTRPRHTVEIGWTSPGGGAVQSW